MSYAEVKERAERIESDIGRVKLLAWQLQQENAAIRSAWSGEVNARDSQITTLKLKVAELEAKLAEHKRLAQEKVDALEELLSKATLPEPDPEPGPEAPKAPAVEVMPGPDYVTRADLVSAIRQAAKSADAGSRHALERVAYGLVNR